MMESIEAGLWVAFGVVVFLTLVLFYFIVKGEIAFQKAWRRHKELRKGKLDGS